MDQKTKTKNMPGRSNAMVVYKRKAPSKRGFKKVKSTALVRYTRGLPLYRSDMKTNDVTTAVYAGDTTGSVTLLNGIQTGDDYNTRDGRQVRIHSVQVVGRVFSADNTVSNCLARLLLVWDHQANGAAPVIANILTSSTSVACRTDANRNRFTILADYKWVTGLVQETATQALALSPNVHVVDIYRKVNRITQYLSTNAAIADISSGSLWMITIGDQAAGAGSTFSLAAQVRFTDD